MPERRKELDEYLALVSELALKYGGSGFYHYHVLFASRAAARLDQRNESTYWGERDNSLFCQVFASRAPLPCLECGAPQHPATSCVIKFKSGHKAPEALKSGLAASARQPLLPQPSAAHTSATPGPRSRDAKGRPVLTLGAHQICNDFNIGRCNRSTCKFLHICSYCSGAHARVTCPQKPPTREYLSTPINIPALAKALEGHPNHAQVKYLLDGLEHGFNPGVTSMPDVNISCANLQSALAEPDIVNKLLEKEVKDRFMMGPFDKPPFDSYRISPIGVATRKYSGKKRLIIDLSSPHQSSIPSINGLIPSNDFSLRYTTIDHAISLIRLAGHGAWLAKADITSAFKVMPIHPDFWHLFGVQWEGKYYFAVRLTFGCKSSPKIFDSLSEALCWILINKGKLPYVIHLLDDFLTVTPPLSPPATGMVTLTSIFEDLGVPLSAEKTVGPAQKIEFLGVMLDSKSFQASLPSEKVERVTLLLQNFLALRQFTKQQLLSLLGHLNYCIRIIPQGRSFISHLLEIATSVPSLFSQVALNDACFKELEMWKIFLSNWNGISFFYDDHVTKPADIELYTDAAPSLGYGGVYGKHWFAAEWPTEFQSLARSSAIAELYPIVVAAILWGHEWTRKKILVYSDNSAAVHIINKGRSPCLDIMKFIRRLTLTAAKYGFIIKAAHVPGFTNVAADALSRFQFQRFKHSRPDSDPLPTAVPPFSDTVF